MSLKVDRLQLEIIINNDQARKSLRLLDDEARTIQKSMKGMKEGTDEWIQATKRLSSIKTQMDNLQDSIGITGLSIKELSARQKEFNMLVSNLPANSPEYAKYKTTLDEINARLKELKGKAADAGAALDGQGGGMSVVFEKVKGAALGLGVAAVAAFSLDAIKEFVKGGVEAAMKLRDTESLLLEELDGQKIVQTDLINLAKQRSATSMYGRLEIEEAEKFLAIQQRTPEQIKKTINAATDLAALTGVTLKEATESLDATMEGRLGKGLGKLEKDFKGLTKEQMYNGEAIDIVAQKYGGLAEREMNTTEGRINLLGKAWKGLQRTLGEVVLSSGGMFSGLIDGATSFLKSITSGLKELSVFSKSAVQTFEEQGRSVAVLVTDIDPLLNRYDELKSKTNLSAKEQAELKSIIGQVTAVMPGAASAFDKYGNAVEISSGRVRDFTKGQIQLLRYENKKAIDETISDLASVNVALADSKYKMDEIAKKGTFKQKNILGEQDYAKDANNEEIVTAERKNQELLNSQIALNLKLGQLRGDSLQQALDAYKKEKEGAKNEDNKSVKEKIDLTKMSEAELNEIISRSREDSASNIDRTNARLAQSELKRRETSVEHQQQAYEKYVDLMREIAELDKTNFADKLSQTEGEIKAVNEKYNNEIKKIQEYQEHNKKNLSPAQNKELDSKVGELEVVRDAQTKQVLEQAEKDFADKVALIHENLRVARMTITGREVYEINKKYDELQKEILDAVDYRYQQEILQANGNKEKIVQAEQNKKDSLAKMQGDLSKLEIARQEETNKAKKSGEITFENDLKALKLKAETDLATGKEKIQMDVNQKYKKLLDENLRNEEETARIKEQMNAEVQEREVILAQETQKKIIAAATQAAQTIMSSLSGVSSAWADYQNAIMQREEAHNTKQKDSLKKQLDSKLISQKQYDIGVAKLDAEADKKKRKMAHDQAVIQKATSVANAIINTAVAISAALTIPIVGIAMAVIVGLLGAAQVGLILATPVPQAASGRYNVTGQQDGKSYSNVPYKSSFTGIPGRPMLVNETGNEIVIDPYTTRNIQLNYPHIIEGINQARVPQRASGQYLDSQGQRSSSGKTIIAYDQETLDAMRAHTEQMKKPMSAAIVYDTIRDTMADVALLEKNVTRKPVL